MSKAIDLTGQRFGNLTAIRQIEERHNGRVIWECVCDCGNSVFASTINLRRGNTKSCGCLRKAGTAQRRAVDIAGQRFGKLTAIKPTEERYDGRVIWECVCDCGNTTFVTMSNLQMGYTKSCGCLRTAGTERRQAVDITGQRFGKLIAIRPTEERHNGRIIWECQCDCGNTTFVTTSYLRVGYTKSCGCLSPALDLAGQRFGKLTAVKPTEKRMGSSVVWECLCDCGNTTFASSNNLRMGNTKSCGCLKSATKTTVDIAGQRFGKLTAIKPTEERWHGQVVWECKCDCGNTAFFGASRLRSGEKKSCGCSTKDETKP